MELSSKLCKFNETISTNNVNKIKEFTEFI